MKVSDENGFVLIWLCVLIIQVALFQQARSTSDDFFVCPSDQRPIPRDYVCDGYNDCPTGIDEADCGSSGYQCPPHEMQCKVDNQCINLVFQCDGFNHCSDGSDEIGCAPQHCEDWELTCGNGKCISKLLSCDGHNDCGDNTDEHGCEQCDSQTQLTCNGGQCISMNWRCDRENDCIDGSDERNCDSYSNTCGIGLFNCSETNCIDGNLLCDGFDDCGDNADEDESICFTLNCGNNDEFTCPDHCISKNYVCDGEYDCIDNSDELHCVSRCQSNQFACITGSCINITEKCNGNEDCTDGSDEFFCPTPGKVQCNKNEFPCVDNLQCIPDFAVCDNITQCKDESDEWSCPISPLEDVNECNHTDNGGCQHNCHDTKYYRYCSCNEGYHLNTTDMSTCVDTNECDTHFGICSQYCENTIGSYFCSCAPGYVTSSEHDCKATGPPSYILFTNWYDIQKVNNTQGSQTSSILFRQLRNAVGIDYHYNLSYVFWTDIIKHSIMRANLDGSNVKEIIDHGIVRPEGIAVDWVHNLIYWVDNSLKRIEVANLNGGQRTVLFTDLHSPKDIIVDPINRWLYWTDKHKIQRASLDGTIQRTFLSNEDHVYWPRGLTLDHLTGTLYWVDIGSKSISKCQIEGEKRQTVVFTNVSDPTSLFVFEDRLYWTERSLGTIYSIDKRTGEDLQTVLSSIYKPMDMIIVHPLIQPLDNELSHPCTINNGGCQYLCLVAPKNMSTCYCPPSSSIENDNKSCSKSNLFLLFSMAEQLRMVSLETDERYDVEIPLANMTLSNIIAVDWDSINDTMFWTDSTLRTINSASISGRGQTVLVEEDVGISTGIAVDWLSRKLYWTDSTLSRIYVSELDGSSKTVLVTLDDGTLTDIVVHPIKGLMFFGVKGIKHPYIKSAYLDGSHQNVIARERDYGSPSVLTIDYQSNRLYWVDTKNIMLESTYLNGSDHEILLDVPVLSGTSGLTIYGDKLYWTDKIGNAIRWVKKYPPYEMGIVLKNREYLESITVYHKNRVQPDTHPCWINNGGCSHLCLTAPSEKVGLVASCKCPTGFVLTSDQKTCQSYLEKYLVFAGNTRIGWVSLDTQSYIDVTTPLNPPTQGVLAIDVDYATNDTYWIDGITNKIYRTHFEGGSSEVIIESGLVQPTTLAVDWIGRLLFWADSSTRRIEVSKLDGRNRKVLFYGSIVDGITSIALDFRSRRIFWSTSISPRIISAYMDGTNPNVIISAPDITLPISFTVDRKDGRLFIADSAEGQIRSYNKNGKDRKIIANSEYPKGVAVDDTYLYWVDRNTGVLYRVDKNNGRGLIELVGTMNLINDLKIVRRNEWLQRGGLQYSCDFSNNFCTHLCLPNLDVDGHKCACPTGIALNPDQRSCPSVPSHYLLFSTTTSIRRVSLDVQDFLDVLLIPNLQNIRYIDYFLHSHDNGSILWSDPINKSIMISNLNGSNVKHFIDTTGSPQGLSVDWTTGNVYYVDSAEPSIQVVSINGKFRKVLVDTGLTRPTSIVVYPKQGLMFWINTRSNPPQIKQANLDGTNQTVLVQDPNLHPVQLALDMVDNWIYWTDRFNGTLERISLNGSIRQTVANNIHNPLGVTIYGNVIFWSNETYGQIVRANKHISNKGYTIYSNEGAGKARGLTIVSRDKIIGQARGSSCSHSNCSYLCLPLSSILFKCACPDNHDNGCHEYIGSILDIKFISSTPSMSMTPPTSTSTTPPTISSTGTPYIGPSISLSDKEFVGIFTTGELTILVLICILFLAVIIVVIILIALYIKYNSIGREYKQVSTMMVKNPLYKKTTFNEDDVSAKRLGFTPNSLPRPVSSKPNNLPASQLNNVSGIKERKKEKQATKNTYVRPKELNVKSVITATNPNIHISQSDTSSSRSTPPPPLLITSKGPEEYKITPVQSHHQQSSVTTHPHSPTTVTADIHTNSDPNQPGVLLHPPPVTRPKTYKPPPPIPLEEPQDTPLSASATGTSKQSRQVKFVGKCSPDPPPIPPRSVMSPTSQHPPLSTIPLAIPPVTTFPVPISPPPMTPPPQTFTIPTVSLGHDVSMLAARNPLFQSTSSNNSCGNEPTKEDLTMADPVATAVVPQSQEHEVTESINA